MPLVLCADVAVWGAAGVRGCCLHVFCDNWKWLKPPSEGLNTMGLRWCLILLVSGSGAIELKPKALLRFYQLKPQRSPALTLKSPGSGCCTCLHYMATVCTGCRSLLRSWMELDVVTWTCCTGRAARRAVEWDTSMSILLSTEHGLFFQRPN